MTTSNDLALLDTNVLVYAYQSLTDLYMPSRDLIGKGFSKELSLCVCPQVLCEFYATVTNPKRVINPATHKEAMAEIEKVLEIEKHFEDIRRSRDNRKNV